MIEWDFIKDQIRHLENKLMGKKNNNEKHSRMWSKKTEMETLNTFKRYVGFIQEV